MRAIVELKGVEKTYAGLVSTPALTPTSLEIFAGQVLAIVGPSGSGKTTLLNLIGGLDRPTAGHIRSCDRDLGSLSDAELSEYRRQCVGFVFQFFNLVESLTVRENVRLARELTGSAADVDDLLEAVGLASKADRFPAELSSGQQQRAAIARALAKNAPLLLADEPTGALDQESGKVVLSLLLAASDLRGCTVVIVTHNTAITRIVDRVIQLRDGKVVSDRLNPARGKLQDLSW